MAQTVAVVTGGSRGIGAAICKELSSQGHAVVIVYSKDTEGAAATAAQITNDHGEAKVMQCDVGDPAQITSLFADISASFGRIDVLVNNAGTSGLGLLSELEWDEATRVLDINLKSVIFCSAAALPLFPENGGVIINIGSVLASQPSGGQGLYAASKAGVEAMTRVMAQELGARNIRVNLVAPGPIDTALLPDDPNLRGYILSRTPLGRIGQPEDIAGVVGFLAGDKAAWLTGQIIAADGGIRV